jgi:hypothetical protein
MSKYLHFKVNPPQGDQRTYAIEIFSKRHGNLLGVIKWFARWRQYAFFPESGTLFNEECLQDIRDQIHLLVRERQMSKKQPKKNVQEKQEAIPLNIYARMSPYDQGYASYYQAVWNPEVPEKCPYPDNSAEARHWHQGAFQAYLTVIDAEG